MLSLVFLQEKLHITDFGDMKFVRIHKRLSSETREIPWNHCVLPLLRWSTVCRKEQVWTEGHWSTVCLKEEVWTEGHSMLCPWGFAPKARSLLYPYMLEARPQDKYATLVVQWLLLYGTFYDMNYLPSDVIPHPRSQRPTTMPPLMEHRPSQLNIPIPQSGTQLPDTQSASSPAGQSHVMTSHGQGPDMMTNGMDMQAQLVNYNDQDGVSALENGPAVTRASVPRVSPAHFR